MPVSSTMTTTEKANYDLLVSKVVAYQNEIVTGQTLGTTQPLSLTDATFTGKSAQATANLSSATAVVGIAAGAFASSGAETGTSATNGGLGSSAASNQPYNSTDFPGYRKARVLILKVDDDELTVSDVVSVLPAAADANAPVYGYLSYRSDLGTDAKWRLWFYYRRASDGLEVPITPTISVTNAKIYIVECLTLLTLPGTALVNRSIAGQLPGEMLFGGSSDITPLGTAAAAGSTGKVADAGHTHASAVTANAAALNPTYPATIGTSTRNATQDHTHAPWTPQRLIHRECEFDMPTVASTSISDPGLTWNANAQGAGAAFSVGASNATAGVIGTIIATAGTTATGAQTAIAWGTNAGLIFPFNVNDDWEYEYYCRTPTASNGTDTFKVRFGIGDFGFGAPTTGMWFEWDANSDTHILCKSATGTVVTTDVTSTVVAGTTFHSLRIRHTAGSSTATYSIDGVDVGTGTVPAAAMGPTWGVVASAGSSTNRRAEIDAFKMNHNFSANRWS